MSAFGIVWFHSSAPGYQAAYAGLAAFIIISFYLEWARSDLRPIELGNLARRLLLPWAFWMIAFTVYNLVQRKPAVQPAQNIVFSILYGAAPHLWYLPFLFFWQSLVRSVARFRRAVPALCGILAVSMFISTPYWRPLAVEVGPPIAQYAQALGGVWVGILLGAASKNSRWWWAVLAVTLAIVYAATLPFPGVGLPYLIATIGIALIVRYRGGALPNPKPISELMFGVYLIHLPIIGLLKKIFHFSGQTLVIVTFILAIVSVYIVRRFGGTLARRVL